MTDRVLLSASITDGLYIAPDSGGQSPRDDCVWRRDPNGWDHHLLWLGGIDEALAAVLRVVLPGGRDDNDEEDENG